MSVPGVSGVDELFALLNDLIDQRVHGTPRIGAELDDEGRVRGRPTDSSEIDGLREEFRIRFREAVEQSR